MKNETITLVGVGDVLPDREQPETIFRHVVKELSSADIAFANGEGAFSDKGSPASGHASPSDPANIDALLNAGFDVISLANNHSLDWGVEGLTDTLTRLKKAGLPFTGAGKNLAEARQPVILERKGTKVGFLAYSSVHPKGYEAESNKPGLVPIRVWTIYEQIDYQPGTPPRIVTIPYKDDLAAMVEDIKTLKSQVDVVVVSFHWGIHLTPRVIPMYCFDIGHAAVDVGADLILGTHTHILKGIEMYHGKAIFYSTSNFAIEAGKSSMGKDFVQALHKLYGSVEEDRRKSLIAKVTIENSKIKRVSYLPCYINDHSEPEIVKADDPRGQEVFNYVNDISKSENLPVHFSWDGDEVLVSQ
jgi:poly-gamma-glutamate capsule biosynthesis protein CapA/YwtB (metallophosphatase superfamily)